MARMNRPPLPPTIPRLVYRPVLSRICAAGLAAFCGWWAGALLLDQRWTSLGHSLPGLVAVCAVAYAVLWRPEVVVDADGVLLRNVARDVRVPWPALRDVDTRYALTLRTDHGRYTSWAATAPGRPSALQSRRTQQADTQLADSRWLPDRPDRQSSSRDLNADSGAAAFMVEQGWSAWRNEPTPDQGAESVRWAWPGVVVFVTAALVAAGVALFG
jgi:hypothetical protein